MKIRLVRLALFLSVTTLSLSTDLLALDQYSLASPGYMRSLTDSGDLKSLSFAGTDADGRSVFKASPTTLRVSKQVVPEQIFSYIPPPPDVNIYSDTGNAITFRAAITTNTVFKVNYLARGARSRVDSGRVCDNFPNDARMAFQAAANIWGSKLKSSRPITIDACWTALPGYPAQGGPSNYILDTAQKPIPNAPVRGVLYLQALANALAGKDLLTSAAIKIDIDSTGPLYRGLDGNIPRGWFDLLTVSLHEIGHGLGMISFANYNNGVGSWAGKYVYDDFLRDSKSQNLTNQQIYRNPSAILGKAFVSGSVWFYGKNTMAVNGGEGSEDKFISYHQ